MKATTTIPVFAKMNSLHPNLFRELVSFLDLQPAYEIGRVRAFWMEDLERVLQELNSIKSSLSL